MAVAKKVEFLGPNRDGEPRRFTVASGTLIEKGSLLGLSGARTAAKHSTTAEQMIAGVALHEKSATDHSTTISAITQAIMTFTSSGSITAGDGVISSTAANTVATAALTSASGAQIIGTAISDATGNVCEVRINL